MYILWLCTVPALGHSKWRNIATSLLIGVLLSSVIRKSWKMKYEVFEDNISTLPVSCEIWGSASVTVCWYMSSLMATCDSHTLISLSTQLWSCTVVVCGVSGVCCVTCSDVDQPVVLPATHCQVVMVTPLHRPDRAESNPPGHWQTTWNIRNKVKGIKVLLSLKFISSFISSLWSWTTIHSIIGYTWHFPSLKICFLIYEHEQ